MIDYDPHQWGHHFFDLKGSMVREIVGRLLVVALWATAVVAFHNYVQPVGIPNTMHALVGVALGLLLVFRTNSSYDRFWEGRKLWGGIVNETRNLARASGVFLRERDPALYRTLVQWTAVFPYAAASGLRGDKDLGPITAQLPPEEVRQVGTAQHVALAVSQRMSEALAEGRRWGHYTEYTQMVLDQNVQQLIDYLGGCERIHKTPMPFAYMVHLRRALVIYCSSLPFALVETFGWGAAVATVLLSFVFFGIEEIGVEIEDPFGTDENDLPLDRICGVIQNNLLAMLPSETAKPD
ncbi:bestrophin family ion channel [Stigmatella sp. ncwal1]|uniref:Bestrophin family ion channel n=1 Tax=Stigmatella ashevillensis TaxID=2995309 RepID=A0ABT5DDY9_9BACT|nr:bestrophin family ion channel [Stigmatella ashevillena]MDC0711866.1 bestrophin family ion channel [Stigmatella ashevillena]